MNVTLSTGEIGYIESTFGQKDKLRIRIPAGLKPSTFEYFSSIKKNKIKTENTPSIKERENTVAINLKFKRCIFDKNKIIT